MDSRTMFVVHRVEQTLTNPANTCSDSASVHRNRESMIKDC